jgi:AhpD family alkylhydroperoxidase
MNQTTNQSRGFVDFDETSAPAGARAMLAGARAQLGFVPAALARMVEAPALVQAFHGATGAFNRTSLGEVERELVVLVMSRVVGCEVCEAMHLPMLTRAGGEALAGRVRRGEPTGDARLDALRRFTEALLATRGDVDAASWEGLLAAGFTRQQALEVVLGVGAYTISMYANRLTQAPVDAALRAPAG